MLTSSSPHSMSRNLKKLMTKKNLLIIFTFMFASSCIEAPFGCRRRPCSRQRIVNIGCGAATGLSIGALKGFNQDLAGPGMLACLQAYRGAVRDCAGMKENGEGLARAILTGAYFNCIETCPAEGCSRKPLLQQWDNTIVGGLEGAIIGGLYADLLTEADE